MKFSLVIDFDIFLQNCVLCRDAIVVNTYQDFLNAEAIAGASLGECGSKVLCLSIYYLYIYLSILSI